MKKIILSTLGFASLLFISSCKTDFDRDVLNTTVSKGNADFTKYVALGNSLTAGYRDGALYVDGQNESYPSMLAKQMMLAGGGQTFLQPMMGDNNGGLLLSTTQIQDTKLYLSGFANGSPVLKYANNDVATNVLTPSNYGTTKTYYQNMGVPGAKSFHLVAAGYGDINGVATGKANPYFVRFATSTTTTVLADAITQKPTFYSLWIGSNDVLSYATSGGIGVDRTGNLDPTTYGSNDISDPTLVKNVITSIVNTLKTAGSSKGVIANIPYVTNIPFFTTVPYNPLSSAVLGLGDVAVGEATVDQLNTGLYGPVKAILTAYGQGGRLNLLSKTGGNPLLIRDETLTNYSTQITTALIGKGLDAPTATAIGLAYGQARQATATDLVLLSTQNVIGKAPSLTTYPYAQGSLNKYGITFPLDDGHVLIPSEINSIKVATDAYNTAIAGVATTYGLALMDANAAMAQLNTNSGLIFDAVKYSSSYITGGTFSLDGVHPNGRGYAIIANYYLKAINQTYGSTLPMVNVNNYSGVTFP